MPSPPEDHTSYGHFIRIRECYLSLLPSSPETLFHKRLRKIIEANYTNPNFKVTSICKFLCLSPMQAHRKVKKHTGLSPGKYLLRFRLRKALDLIQDTDMTFGEIAHQTGFRYLSSFSKAFKEIIGFTPTQVRLSLFQLLIRQKKNLKIV